jgi:hypothetical protein
MLGTILPAATLAIGLSVMDEPVRVVLDLDLNTPGMQSTRVVEPGTTLIDGIGVFVYDPEGTRRLLAIGYIGGIDRGIALGHIPNDRTVGTVTAMSGSPHTPVNPGNFGGVDPDGSIQKAFAGPEIQYYELGAQTDAPLPSAPTAPAFTADVHLENASPGDVFSIALADNVVLWTEGHNGAFSTRDTFSLDTGGDAVPDGTPTVVGLDADAALPAPPAAYLVDYIDGVDRAAAIIVRCPTDFNADGVVDTRDVLDFLNAWVVREPRADFNGDGTVNTQDVLAFLNAWNTGC